jgi:ArsR family transcriptional regulator
LHLTGSSKRDFISYFVEMYAIIISMDNEMKVRMLKALADPTRIHIVELLSNCCCGRATVRENGDVEAPTAGEVCCHITGAEKITSTVSHHLHELESAGLIRMERRGKSSVCSLVPDAFRELSAYLHLLAEGENENGCC